MDTSVSTNERQVDDFHEFLADAYIDTVAAFADAGLNVQVVAGAVGHYLLIAHPGTGSGSNGVEVEVEVTSAGGPLPASPADVDTWLLTCGPVHVSVPGDDATALVASATALLA